MIYWILRLLFGKRWGHRSIGFSYRVGRPTRKERIMLELSCTNEEKVPITITPVTSTGKLSKIQSASLVVTAQNGYGTVELIDDSSFYVVSGDDPGDTEYLVSGDADLGEGVITISDIVLLRVAGASAAYLGLSAGTAVPK
jgi:hypothetical protein